MQSSPKVASTLLATVLLCCVTADGARPFQSEKPHPMVVKLQGDWEINLVRNGDVINIRKRIEGTHETVQVFVAQRLVQQHEVDFEITDEGPVTVFRWKNGIHTGGAKQGAALPDGQAIVKLIGGDWICVHGMLESESSPLQVERYQRPR